MEVTFALALLLGYLTVTQMAIPNFHAVIKQCLEGSNVTSDLTWDIIKGNIKLDNATTNILCGVRCIMFKFGFVDGNSNMALDNILNHFGDLELKSKYKKYVDVCDNSDVDSATPCRKAFALKECLDNQTRVMLSG
ncbi:hypothetical protein KR093_000617 [Drosophila rubida]|uniref:Uncharacterized protein n=1 Tax=Drosophila rubida TaxID=30044 RepID=A0AAD4JQS0_9MUSC|nr:hypothetical protein KR093_000617 [Drosophila rubida]